MDIASTMRVPTARFVEWQHPDVKAVLRAEAHRGRVVATQAQILLAFSVSAPLISRFVGATVLPSAAFSGVIDTLAVLGVALALYRLLPLTVSSRVIASDEVGAERARRDGTLSPQQRALLGDSYVPRTERKSRAHADDASAGSQPADQPLRRRSSVADARFGAGRSADKRDCVAPMFVGIGPLSPRYVSVPAGRGIVTSSARRMISNAHGERGDRVELSRTPDSTDHAGSRGPRVESDADVDAHIASLGAAIDNSFAGRDGSDSTFKKTIQFESYNGEFDGSAQATPSPSYVGREGARTEMSPESLFLRSQDHVGSFGTSPSALGSPTGAYQYRPSPPPRARASPIGGSTGVDLSRVSPTTRDSTAIFATLHPDSPAPVEVWTDRLREWFAFRLLKPLAVILQRSDAVVNEALAALGETNVRVGSLCAESTSPDGVVGARITGSQEHDSMLLEQVRARLEILHAQAKASLAPSAPSTFGAFGGASANPQLQQHAQQVQLLGDALDAVITHLRLMTLLRAELPKGLLPAMPPGYAAQRILELAEGTCVVNFSFNSGGDWAGDAWTPELPDDSQLLCYLFCAFLEVPGWVFAVDGVATAEGSSGGSGAAGVSSAGARGLYFAQPPPPHIERYSAVLTARPPSPVRDGAVVVIMPRTSPPVFLVLTAGDVAHAFPGHGGVFRALVLLLLHAREKNGGSLGGVRMGAANVALESIFMPGRML